MRLLTLPGEIQEALREEEISRGQGLALAGLVGRPQLRLVWRTVKEGGLSVRATEELVRSVMQPRGRRRTRDLGRDAEIEEIEERMREALGTMVTIKHDALSGSGKVEIKYSSKGELQNLWSRITGGEVRWTWGEKPEET
jgi:ParB family chromosome partitioning protein